MTTWYSDAFGADGDNDIVVSGPPSAKIPVDFQRGRIYKKRAFFKGLPLVATPDVVAMFPMRSSDRLWDLLLSTDSGSTAAAANIGLYGYGTNAAPVGAVPSAGAAAMFATALDIGAAPLDRSDVFKEAAVLNGWDRGKQLWEMVNIANAATYAKDPGVMFVVALTVTTSFTVADSIIMLEANFTAGS